MGFSKDFVWGAATSAYQTEGAVKGEGKGKHIWDVYTDEPGHVFEGHSGLRAIGFPSTGQGCCRKDMVLSMRRELTFIML